MTTLTGTTPTPRQFADALRDTWGPVLREAAGADGRLSRPEAERIAERADPEWVVSDNASNWLRFSGQQTVSANKLIDRLHTWAEEQATVAAGANGKLSLVEARSLPADLQAELFYLRGKGLPDRVEPATVAAWAEQAVRAALDAESATRLDAPPWQVRGKRPVVENVPHPASGTRAIAYVADGELYFSRAASAGPGVGLVGWYHVGPVPADLQP